MLPKARILTYHRIGYPRKGKSYEAQTALPQRFKAQLQLIRLLGFWLHWYGYSCRMK